MGVVVTVWGVVVDVASFWQRVSHVMFMFMFMSPFQGYTYA